MPAVDICPFLISVGARGGRPSSEVRPGFGSLLMARGPCGFPTCPTHPSLVQAGFPGLHSDSWIFPPLPVLGPAQTDIWGQAHTAASGESGGGAGKQE